MNISDFEILKAVQAASQQISAQLSNHAKATSALALFEIEVANVDRTEFDDDVARTTRKKLRQSIKLMHEQVVKTRAILENLQGMMPTK